MEITTYHGGNEITEISQALWVTDDIEIAEEYGATITTLVLDDSRFAGLEDLDIEVLTLEEWPQHAEQIIAAGYTGLRFDGDLSPCGTLHRSWLICDPTVARIVTPAI